MKGLKSLVVAIVAALVLSACSAMGPARTSVEVQLLVHAATAQVIDRDPAKAEGVLAMVSEARGFVNAAESVSVAALAADVRSKINWRAMEPASMVLLNAILAQAEAELRTRLGEAELSEQGRLSLFSLFDLIEMSAKMAPM